MLYAQRTGAGLTRWILCPMSAHPSWANAADSDCRSPVALAHRCAPSGVLGSPVTLESKEFQCFPKLCLNQFSHPMKPGAGGLFSAQVPHTPGPCAWPGCLGARKADAAAGHPGHHRRTTMDKITRLLSRSKQRPMMLCHKWAQIQSLSLKVSKAYSAFLTAIHQNFKVVIFFLQGRGTAWHPFFPFYLTQ